MTSEKKINVTQCEKNTRGKTDRSRITGRLVISGRGKKKGGKRGRNILNRNVELEVPVLKDRYGLI